MPVKLVGAIKYTLESNTPVPYQLCQCEICRKVGGYMGSVNVMGNTKTLQILRGKDKIREYIAPVKFDENDQPSEMGICKRSFCEVCSSMLWNYHDEYPDWIYPFASTIDSPNPLPTPPAPAAKSGDGDSPGVVVIMRQFCPDHVPLPEGAQAYPGYAPQDGIEIWHKKHGYWVD